MLHLPRSYTGAHIVSGCSNDENVRDTEWFPRCSELSVAYVSLRLVSVVHRLRILNFICVGDFSTSVYSLAQYYQHMNDPKTGVYFHEKCLEISRLTNDRGGEMSANHRLGLVYDKMVGLNTARDPRGHEM